MAINNMFGTQNWREKHFQVRLGGLAGLLVGTIGLILAIVGYLVLGIILAVLGGAAAVAALVFEIRMVSQGVASRRSTAGASVAIQVLLAAFLLVEINAFAFFHYHRFDWTWDREFTLDDDIKQNLAKLRGETTIVIHLRHNFGQLTDKRDEYDHAAERVVIDKVQDIVEQFREFGPQFRVILLDVKDKRYNKKLEDETKDSKELAQAIKRSTEDSIFVVAHNKVQSIGFQELFQLDKNASQKANDGGGNLVLHFQGIRPFSRRILNLDERKPKIALGTIHRYLTMESDIDQYTMRGVKKALIDHGFKTEDILLKKLEGVPAPEAAVYTFDESKYERLELEIAALDRNIAFFRKKVNDTNKLLKHWKTATLKALTKEYADQLRGKEVTEEGRKDIMDQIARGLDELKMELAEARKDQKAVVREQKKLNVSGLAEQKRITDLKAKLERKLADCDLLILPRMTLFDVNSRRNIPNSLYSLDRLQMDAIKDFIKRGKPVMICFGPTNQPGNMPADFMHGGSDGFEELLGELGIRFGKETILFNSETKAFAESGLAAMFPGMKIPVDLPPVQFQWKSGGRPGRLGAVVADPRLKPNPIAESMLLTVAGLDKLQFRDLGIRHPRPVTYEPGHGNKNPGSEAVFLMSDPRGWKEPQPFPSEGRVPAPGLTNTGQFPIGVAVETSLPASWNPEHKTVRVVAIGHGGLFIGNQLSPVKEKLLLDSCNWLLGRDDMLAHKKTRWEYPRVDLSENGKALWLWGTRLGIPLIFAFVGIAVLLKRSLR